MFFGANSAYPEICSDGCYTHNEELVVGQWYNLAVTRRDNSDNINITSGVYEIWINYELVYSEDIALDSEVGRTAKEISPRKWYYLNGRWRNLFFSSVGSGNFVAGGECWSRCKSQTGGGKCDYCNGYQNQQGYCCRGDGYYSACNHVRNTAMKRAGLFHHHQCLYERTSLLLLLLLS